MKEVELVLKEFIKPRLKENCIFKRNCKKKDYMIMKGNKMKKMRLKF